MQAARAAFGQIPAILEVPPTSGDHLGSRLGFNRRPIRIVLWAVLVIGIIFIGYSWIAGYSAFGRDPVTGQLVPTKVRFGPLESLRNITELFPMFIRAAVPMLAMVLFYMSLMILQFVALFWYMSRGRTYVIYPGEYDVTFDDVRGQPAVVDATKEVVTLFQGFLEFRKRGGYPPHGILFEGPPGTGKTLLGKAIAGSSDVPFIYASGTSFSNMFFGVGNLRVAYLFKKARRMSERYGGAVIFLDELDAVGGSRGGVSAARSPLADPTVPQEHRDFWSRMNFVMPGGTGGMGSMLVNELLVQMDGLVLPNRRFRTIKRALRIKPKIPNYNILIIGATNMASVLDPALLRPGRFDRKIHVGNPSAEGRKDIIEYYLAKVKHERIDLDRLANATVGYSPARIKNIINEGLIFALQDGREALTYDDIWAAKLTDEIGLKQPVTYSAWEKESTAIHEAGHAVAAWFLQPSEAVQVVTIQKRESALGLVHTMDLEERFSRTRDEMLAEIKVFLAGMGAEHIWYGQTTSGPSSDLRVATMKCAQMVAYYGMGNSLVSAAAVPPNMWGIDALGELLKPGPTRDEIEAILQRCRQEVEALLRQKAHVVEAIRDVLMEQEQMTGDEFAALMESLNERRDLDAISLRRPPKMLGAARAAEGAGNGHRTLNPPPPFAEPPPQAPSPPLTAEPSIGQLAWRKMRRWLTEE
jgi:cell division protease FtsH